MSANIENHMVLASPAIYIPRETLDLDTALDNANLLSLDDLSKDWCLQSLIEAMEPDERAKVIPLLRLQAAREMVAGDEV